MSDLKPFAAPRFSFSPLGAAQGACFILVVMMVFSSTKATAQFLFSEAAQEIFAKFDYRPLLPSVENKYRDHFQQTELIDPEKAFGGWDKIQRTIFGDGGAFDQIYVR